MKGYVLLADGFETIEALTPVDILRRCGIQTTTVSITQNTEVTSSHGVKVEADTTLGALEDDGDFIVLPGGYPGYANLRGSEAVLSLVRDCYSRGKYIAAICGAPTVLKAAGIAPGAMITCHASVLEELKEQYRCTEADVQVDGTLVTGKGAGLSLAFALRLAEILADGQKVQDVKKGLQLR